MTERHCVYILGGCILCPITSDCNFELVVISRNVVMLPVDSTMAVVITD